MPAFALSALDLARGALLGLSLAAPPGPVAALMADSTLRRGPLAGMRVGWGATTADLGFFLLAWAGATALLATHVLVRALVSLAGAGVLLFYAYGAWRSATGPAAVERVAPATFVTGFVAAATSPFNFAWWVGPGSAIIAEVGVVLVAGMFVGILAWVAFFVYALTHAGRRIRELQRLVAWASAVVLAGFAAWIGWVGFGLLLHATA